MHTLRSAAALLSAARSAEHAAPLLRELGFTAPPLALDAGARAALGVHDPPGDALLFDGPGTLRALAVDAPATGGAALRDYVGRLATRVAARSPHLLWVVVVAERSGPHTAMAAWSGDRRPPRVAALVVDRARVVDSDAETLAALAGATDAAAADVLVHARWLEILGRDALGRRFYRALERVVGTLAESADGAAAPAERQEVALLYVSRLLFLAFLEAKGWLAGDRDYLARGYAACVARGGGYHRRVLLPLFFGTLNTPRARRAPAARSLGDVPFLNGGLFARSPLERRCRGLRFSDAALGAVFGELLTRYQFTAREDGHGWSEAAVDPEMLGKAFESLMAARDRRASGAFYTPQPLVEHVTGAALAHALAGSAATTADAAAALRGEPVSREAGAALRARLDALRLLDPACGSGAFLVHALERLAALAGRLGDPRPVCELRREILARSIFGVDVNPTAVWLCELRLWLSVVIESAEPRAARVRPLPNLDHQVRVGDSLAGGEFGAAVAAGAGRRVAALRLRYSRASGARKRTLARALDRADRAAATAALEHRLLTLTARRRELLAAARSPDLFGARRGADRAGRLALAAARAAVAATRAELRAVHSGAALPFAFAVHFADVAAAGGFSLVLGNPPWVRLHNIPKAARERLRAEYKVYRDAAWMPGAAGAHAGPGFAAQVDLAALFVERSLQLLAPGGTVAVLLPAKLWRALAGGGVRRLLATESSVLALEDFSEAPAAFDAAVYPSLLVARRGARASSSRPGRVADDGDAPAVDVALHRASGALRWATPGDRLPFADAASPWLLLPNEVRRAFECVTARGTPLSESPLGRPTLGVKCGCNDAFVVDVLPADEVPLDADGLVAVRAGGRGALLPGASLRPLVRGETVAAWQAATTAEHLVWTHDDRGRPLAELAPSVAAWLGAARPRLARRTDLRPGAPWWSLFRTDAALADQARVVWADMGRAPRAAVLPPGDARVPLNSCYAVRCPSLADAHAFAALLNSPLAAAWLNALAEPARGGYRRYLGWTVALLPIPRDWARARALLAPLGEGGAAGEHPPAAQLARAALDAYRLRPSAAAALVAWNER